MGVWIDVAIGAISVLLAHFITLYVAENPVTYFGILVGVAFLTSMVLHRFVAAASQLLSVIAGPSAVLPTTMDSTLCSALMHDPTDPGDLDGTFVSYTGLPSSAVAEATSTSSQLQSSPSPSASPSAPASATCDVSLNDRLASYGT